MVNYCVAYNCKTRAGNGLSFHHFPKDEQLRKAWCEAISREDFKPTKNFALCSKHFKPEDFEPYVYGHPQLKKGCVPSVFDFTTPLKRKGVCVVLGCVSNITSKKKMKDLKGITFHRFPTQEKRKQQWANAIGRINWRPSRHSRICSAHFPEKMIDRTSLCCVRIRENAVPSIFPKKLRQRKRLLPNPEEGRFIRRSKTSKPSATATQLGNGTPTTKVENIKIKEEPEEDIVIQLESVLEVENDKIKTEPLSDSELELPDHLTQKYRSDIVQKYPNSSDNDILGIPWESRCNIVQKCPDPSDDPILVVPQESRSHVQKCADPSDDLILVVPQESRCHVQKCPDPSDDLILVVPQKSRCDVVQKSSDLSDDAILGVPVEYLPMSCRDVCEKSEQNQFSASDSATSVHPPFTHHDDLAGTSQNAPSLIPIEFVTSPRAVPISENLPAENSVSKNLFDENSVSMNLSDVDSISENRKKDEFDLFGEFVANKLRSMDRKKAIQVQSKFGDLIFKLETGELNMQSAKIWLNNVQFT